MQDTDGHANASVAAGTAHGPDAGDRGPHEVVRRHGGARRGRPAGRGRDDPRAARPQRRGQDVARLDRRRPAPARRRAGCEVCGIDVARVAAGSAPRSSGIAPQETGVYLSLRVRDNLRFFAGLAGLSRARDRRRGSTRSRARSVSPPLLDRRASQLSGGERRRLHTAIALLHRPALVLLDEPTTGADVVTRAQILELVRGLADDGSAVVYSTHYLHEIETLDADVAFIDRGRIVARGQHRRARARSTARARSSSRSSTSVPDVGAGRRRGRRRHDGAHPRRRSRRARRASCCPRLGADARLLSSIEIVRPSLESVYLTVTGRRVRRRPPSRSAAVA